MLKKLVLVPATGSLALTAAACNTVKGLGRDVQSVGEAGERAL
jgi:entericidin B